MVLMDTTVVNVALPAIARDFSADLPALQWVSNGYTLTFAALLLTAGALADKLGGRRIFLIGVVSFGILSAASAFSVNISMLVVLRALLGIAGALLLPSSLSIVANAFADPAERARALGNWAAITGLALVAGPPIGGLLTDLVGWRAIFVINVPIAVVSLAITLTTAGETARSTGRGLDPAGQLTAALALAALTFGLIHAEQAGWTASLTLGWFVIFVLSVVGFGLAERRTERHGGSPMLPLGLFRNRTFSASLFAGLVVNFAIAGLLFTLSLLFQQGRGYSSLVAGLAFLPLTVPTAINPIFTGRLVARIGPRVPALLGLALMAAGTALQAVATSPSGLTVVVGSAALLLVGFGVSFALPALVAGLLTSTPREQAGVVSGALNSARQTGAVLGVAVLGAVLAADPDVARGTRFGLLLAAGLLLVAGAAVAGFTGRCDEKAPELAD
jgi:DHA2 family methylenomycin A resistance protein-like MFS transporter